ncbi:MAG: outer membrane lipoprotein carrier protein LolA [Myxococcales bacterium]|nr:outer membrane lipoprotein carrier protein LolA [Myxococcales bacterium]
MPPSPPRPRSSHRLSLLVAISLGALLGLVAISRTSAQAPRDARAVAALVQGFYDQTRSFQADFHQTRFTKVYGRYDRARGTVRFEKPGRMRWDYAAPNGQIFVSDGERLLIYQPPEEGEDHGQLIEREVSDDQLPAAFAFLTGTGRLDRDFRFRLLDSARQGFRDGYVLELRPREPSPHYERVLFFVRIPEGTPAGVIHRVLIIDSAGNRNRFDFSNMRFNRPSPAGSFSYTPPTGTRRVHP